MDKVRQSAAGMRQDDLAARKVLERIAHEQVHSSAASFMRIIKHRLGQGGMDKVGIDRVSWVDEDDSLSFTQLCPNGSKTLMAEVGFAIAIAGEKGDTVSCEVVKGIGDLAEGGLGVEERGERGKKSIGTWVLLPQGCAVLVAVTGKFRCFDDVFLDAYSWSGDGENGGSVPDTC